MSPEALVTCICQVSLPSTASIAPGSDEAKKKEAWTKRETLHLIDSFLCDHLAGLQNDIQVEKFRLMSNCVETHKTKDKVSDAGQASSSDFAVLLFLSHTLQNLFSMYCVFRLRRKKLQPASTVRMGRRRNGSRSFEGTRMGKCRAKANYPGS